jgi:cystine transport system permease protein
MTVFLGLSSFVLGSTLGLLVALARLSSIGLLRGLAFAYVSIFRGTPLLVQILLIYFGLPRYGITLDPVPAALMALTLFSAAYLSENFRSGINAVDRGQWEAAMSMGMGYWKAMTRVILPQGLRIAIPPVGSRMIALIKDTSLASTITVVELTRVADQVGASTFRYMEMFLMVGLIYWVINQILTIVQTLLENRISRRYI